MSIISSIQLDKSSNNVIIKEVRDSQVTVNTVNWDDFVQKYTIDLQERIEEQKKLIKRTEDSQELERLKLSGVINNLQSELQQKEIQIRQIVEQYEGIDLSEKSSLHQRAIQLFLNGELDNALKELEDAKLEEEEMQQAEARVLKANILQLKNRFEEAERNYKRAVEIYPSWKNSLTIANYYRFLNKFKLAEEYYIDCLKYDVSNYQKAATLNNLGVLQRDKNEFDKAVQSYAEALEIRWQLAKDNPQTYLTDVAMTLINLGNLQYAKNEFYKADQSFTVALKIYWQLEEDNPQTFLPDLAGTLNNLGVLQRDKNEFDKAVQSFTKALEIKRQLAEDNPQTYLPGVAMTLINLGNLRSDKNELDKAVQSFTEALELYRQLAKDNPQTYLPDLAGTLNNLGVLLSDKNELDKAGQSYNEALEIRRQLAGDNPQTYLPEVAATLNNLGVLLSDKNEFDKAVQSYTEALEIRRLLAGDNPETFIPDVGMTLINISRFYQESKPDKELSLKFLKEAFISLASFSHLGFVQKYLYVAVLILNDWGINDVDEFLKKT